MRITGNLVDIPTRYFPNTFLKSHRCTNLLGHRNNQFLLESYHLFQQRHRESCNKDAQAQWVIAKRSSGYTTAIITTMN
jgi:hypothetical protein